MEIPRLCLPIYSKCLNNGFFQDLKTMPINCQNQGSNLHKQSKHWMWWGLTPLRHSVPTQNNDCKEQQKDGRVGAFSVSQHSPIEMLASMPGWTFCGGRLNVNWKMLPAVQPEHPHLVVLAKKNKGNYYWHFFFILIHPPSALERKSHGLSEIKGSLLPMTG